MHSTIPNIANRIRMLRNSESATTLIRPSSNTLKAAAKNQGNGSPTKTSKILLPMDELPAISPLPALATITEVSKSGTLVPAANTVSPIMPSGMPRMRPMVVAHHTMKYEYTPNQQMLVMKDNAHHDCHRFLRTSGTVKCSEYIMGADSTYITRPFQFSGNVKSM